MNKFEGALHHILSLREDSGDTPDYGYLIRLHETWPIFEEALILASAAPFVFQGTSVADQLLQLATKALGLPPEAGVLEFVTECKSRIDGPAPPVTRAVTDENGQVHHVFVSPRTTATIATLAKERDEYKIALEIANGNADAFRRDCEAAEERAEAAEGAYKAANESFDRWKDLADKRQMLISEIASLVGSLPERSFLLPKVRRLQQLKMNLDNISGKLEDTKNALEELL